MKDILQSDTTLLKKFAGFLKENYLEELANEEMEIINKMDIPLMKLFENMPHEELVRLTIQGLEKFLTEIEEDKAYEANEETIRKWERDELEGIPKHAVQPSDLVLVNGAQKLALMNFIPKFTKDSAETIKIIQPLQLYYMRSQEIAFEALFRIRKETEDALRESEEKFRAVSQSAVDAILIANLDGKIIFWNRGAENMFGFSEEEALNKDFSILMSKQQREQLENDLRILRETGESRLIGKTLEITACRKDKTGFPVEISLSSFETNEGRLVSAIIHDISESKKAAKKLEENAHQMAESNAELEQFAYIASHDMKEPLRMVTNYLQLLQKRIGTELDEESKQYIDYAVNGATRMRTLITDLLEYSRVNRAERKLEPVNLQDVFEEVLNNLAAQINEKNAKITSDPLPLINSDHLQMVQLFQNLVSNAIKFSDDKQPVIHVCVENNNDKWLFCVKDNGIGIEPEFKDKIFKMFQRLHSREEYPGTGIGLAICKKIVERFGGEIWFESVPGEGTTFYFTLENKADSAVNERIKAEA